VPAGVLSRRVTGHLMTRPDGLPIDDSLDNEDSQHTGNRVCTVFAGRGRRLSDQALDKRAHGLCITDRRVVGEGNPTTGIVGPAARRAESGQTAAQRTPTTLDEVPVGSPLPPMPRTAPSIGLKGRDWKLRPKRGDLMTAVVQAVCKLWTFNLRVEFLARFVDVKTNCTFTSSAEKKELGRKHFAHPWLRSTFLHSLGVKSKKNCRTLNATSRLPRKAEHRWQSGMVR